MKSPEQCGYDIGKIGKKTVLALSMAAVFTTAASADTQSEIETLKKQIAQLQEKTDLLVDETSNLQTGFNYTVVESGKAFSGLGDAASKVYYSRSPLSIGGYGEMYFQSTSSGESVVDLYRFVPYIGYKFSDTIILNTEIEFEHGGVENDDGTSAGGEVIVEFMYLDFLLSDETNLRLGNFLVPMGLINQRHEPTLFYTTQRPATAKYLIPTTWNESGAMLFGTLGDGLFTYNLAAVTALDTAANSQNWLRSARGGSFKNKNPELAGVARLEYTQVAGLDLGASLYYGSASKEHSSALTMWDLHYTYQLGGFKTYGVYTESTRSDSKENFGPDAVEKAAGGYAAAGYDLLALTASQQKLPLFIQYEQIAPQAEITGGTSGGWTTNITGGINYNPHEQVVLKADYTTSTGPKHQTEYIVNLGLGFVF